ncbi:hypothetical protein VB780_30775 [Leptolyngbya sp. CCNP1308]|uniref:hypothetical protein n=1 Tax=Leptolyngbya sp. CCNP1308 TaxID=3110255 RepID=UPI002B1F377E|nr:hypothetical protein [Leptolyngbya sp. CCNP1308]MEA5452995.1 hypothetical protein [Leptolyngbya sp. CCNP1308]
MKTASTCLAMPPSPPGTTPPPPEPSPQPEAAGTVSTIAALVDELFMAHLQRRLGGIDGVMQRLTAEIERICAMSDRIQASGDINHWQTALVRHRVSKCLAYYDMGSNRGRVELHSSLSAIVYRHVAPQGSHLGFKGRYALLEDFMQIFYIEVLNAFRREHELPATYTPRTRLELAEYMAFSEQYAKRRINLRGGSQQLIVLRAQAFSRRQPAETSVDMALVSEGAKTEAAEGHARSSVVQQVREKMMAEVDDPGDGVMRDRVINALMQYLKTQNQTDCVDYLVLKLKDCSAAEIDDILGLSARERDYLQQRFKYHVEKFSQQHEWQLVHQWLGANLEARLGMTPTEWGEFLTTLPEDYHRFLDLKRQQIGDAALTDEAIAQTLGWTPKKVQRNWTKVLKLAWTFRNQVRGAAAG